MILFNQIFSMCVPDEVPIMPAPLTPIFAKAVQEQLDIGWKQIFCGRLSYTWGVIIANHPSDKKVPEIEMSPLIWGRKVSKQIFLLMISLWKQVEATQ